MGTWRDSDRRSRLPSNWGSFVRTVLARDGHRCTWTYRLDGTTTRCLETSRLEVDHIRNDDNHDLHNLRTLCHDHHAQKTQGESGRARSRNLAIAKKKFRRTEEHPGLAYMKQQRLQPTVGQ